ncbi:hypothetical protein F4677DRAFT_457741 [Hypoxylon crocopeplum]|nr:hypothetical protein F4677DRAFT_457741 [Hypoxylon crocopeplum]
MPGFTVASARRASREPYGVAAPRVHAQLAGCILWLPPKAELGSGCDSGIEEDRCNHPVVILSPQVDDGKVIYLMITSLKGKDLKSRFSQDSTLQLRLEHVPIRPCRPHPDNGMLLSLDDVSLEMRKKSYVKTNTQHCIKLTFLRPYDRRGPDYVLSRKSYHELIQHAKFAPPAPHPASNTVPFPTRVRQHDQPTPITRERSGSYGEYVSALRGLESGTGSPPRVGHVPTTNTDATRYPRTTVRRWEGAQSAERDRLLPVISHGYSSNSYNTYPGTYPGGHPAYGHSAAVRNGYQRVEPPEPPFDWKTLWKMIFWIVVAVLGGYGIWCGVSWLVDMARSAGTAIKAGIEGIGNQIEAVWSRLSNFIRP